MGLRLDRDITAIGNATSASPNRRMRGENILQPRHKEKVTSLLFANLKAYFPVEASSAFAPNEDRFSWSYFNPRGIFFSIGQEFQVYIELNDKSSFPQDQSQQTVLLADYGHVAGYIFLIDGSK